VDCVVEENGEWDTIYEWFRVTESVTASAGSTTYTFVPNVFYRLFPSKRFKKEGGIQKTVESSPINARVVEKDKHIWGDVIGATIIEVHGQDLESKRQSEVIKRKLDEVLRKRKRNGWIIFYWVLISLLVVWVYKGNEKLSSNQQKVARYTKKDLHDVLTLKWFSDQQVEEYIERFEKLIDRLEQMLQSIYATGGSEWGGVGSSVGSWFKLNGYNEKMIRLFLKQYVQWKSLEEIKQLLDEKSNLGELLLDLLITGRAERIGEGKMENNLFTVQSHEIVVYTLSLLRNESTWKDIEQQVGEFEKKMSSMRRFN